MGATHWKVWAHVEGLNDDGDMVEGDSYYEPLELGCFDSAEEAVEFQQDLEPASETPEPRSPRPTNVDIVTAIMSVSECGALIQPFVITALERYSQLVLAASDKELENSLIHIPSWRRCAAEVLHKLDRAYGDAGASPNEG